MNNALSIYISIGCLSLRNVKTIVVAVIVLWLSLLRYVALVLNISCLLYSVIENKIKQQTDYVVFLLYTMQSIPQLLPAGNP